MAFTKTNPAKQTTKAAKKVGKALSAFTSAADTLEVASAEHLAVADNARRDAGFACDAAYDDYSFARVAAEKAYQDALETAKARRDARLDHASALEALAEVNEDAALAAQQNADSLRTLLAVA